MITRTYTCEVINNSGVVIGSRVCRVMFWCSGKTAYDIILSTCSESTAPVNFRAVK